MSPSLKQAKAIGSDLETQLMECIFTLKYDVGGQRCDPDALVEGLGAAGCTDALVGTGEPGYLALEFTREADSLESKGTIW